jgi:putative FmdB family regulatory protein
VPTYEYVCANGHRTEVMHGIYAPGPEACPICGAPVRKAFLAPSVHFKGSGWAKVDRRSSSGSKKTEDEAAATVASGDSKSPSSAESRSEGDAATPTGAQASGEGAKSASPKAPASSSAPAKAKKSGSTD